MGVLIINSGDPAWTIPAGGTSITSVVGTTGVDTVNVTSGAKVSFDSSFNAGTDKIYIQGDSTSYKVSNSGATVTLTDATGNTIVVPAGAVGQTLVFGDGSAILKIDGTTLKLGTQTVTTTATAVATTAVTAGSTTSDSQFGTTTGTPTFTVEAGAASVTEGGSATFTVKLANPPATGTATVNYTLTGTGTAVLGTDTGTSTPGNSGTLTFTAGGATTQTITVPVTFDSTTETGEGLKLEIASPSTGAALGTTTSVTTAIADPATPTFTITGKDSAGNNITAGTPTQEGKNITFTVTPSGIVDKDTTLTVNMTGAGSATITNASSADFTSAQTITFKAGETAARTAQITVVDDTTTEGIEAYKAQLLSGTTEVTSISGLITDPITTVTLSQSATSGSINEGQSVTYTVTADRAAPTGGIVIPYTLGSGTGYATLTTDYTGSSALTGTITIPAGSTTGTLILNAVEDNITEAAAEKVGITLGTPTTQNVVLGNTVAQETTIADTSQGLAAGTIALSTSATSVDEGSAITYTVTVGTAPTAALNVPYTLSGTATTGTDYTGSSAATGNITIAAGATTGTLTLTTLADSTTEVAETVINTITAPTNYSLVTGKNTTTTTINDTSTTVAGSSFAFTLSSVSGKADVITGGAGNDSINGTINNTWENGDITDGAGGVDTIDARVTAASQTLKPTTSNVEKIELQVDSADIKAFTFDASLTTGITEFWLKNMATTSNSTTGTGGDEVVTVSNLLKTAAIGVKGGDSTTGIAATTGGDLYVKFGSAASSDTQTVKLDAAYVNALTLETAETVKIENIGATASTILSTIAVFADSAVKTLNFSGTGYTAIAVPSAAALTTIDATGCTTATSGVSIGSSTALTQTTTTKFTGGAGNDAVYIANIFADTTAAAKYDGGAGTDTLGVGTLTTLSSANAAILNAALNFETAAFTNTGVTAIQTSLLSNIHNFVLVDSSANIAVSGIETADSVTIKNDSEGTDGGDTLTFTGQVAGQTLNLKLGGGIDISGETTSSGNSAISLGTGISKLIINSTGLTSDAANTIKSKYATTTGSVAIDNGTVQALEITGSKDLTINGAAANNSAANVSAGFSGAISVDASTFTGKLDIHGSKATTGDVIKGGSANDTIATAGGIDVLTGNGGNDIFVISGAVAGDATTQIQITDFVSGTDTLKVLKVGSSGPALGTPVWSSTAVNVSTATTLSGALDLAAAGDGSANAAVKWFTYGGSSYVVVDNTVGATLAATDAVIKLTGITSLASSDVVIA